MAEYPEYCDNDLLLDASRIYAMLGNRDSAFFIYKKHLNSIYQNPKKSFY